MIDRLPPQNLEAESSFLGSLLMDREAIFKVSDSITPSDFYDKRHEIIYRAMLRLFEKRLAIDLVTINDELSNENALEGIGGAQYLTELLNGVPSSAHVVHYATIIREKATLRRLTGVGSELVELGFKESERLDTTLDRAEQLLFAVSQKYTKQNFVSLSDVLSESFERIDELHKHKESIRGIPTGFKALDNLLAGFQKSDLIVLAARPSMGKTSLALNIAQHAATHEKIPVGLFSLEMSKEQLVDRLLAGESGIDSWKLRTGHLTDEDFPKIGQAMATLSEAPIFIDDSPVLTVMEIRSKARRLQSEHGLGLLVIDYLQLMQGSYNRDSSRVQEISEISRSLKALARELAIPVIAISQLSRAVEQRPSHIPQLADLRESGSIEQDADVVIFIYRDDYYDPETERKNIADLLIKKHRNGPTGQIELYFEPAHMKFYNLERQKTDVAEDIF